MENIESHNLFDRLKDETDELWQLAQDHPFVHGISDGTLPRGKFIHYLKQDYAYLIGYSRAIAVATSKGPDLKLMAEFSALLNETLNTEMQLHRDYCAGYGITGAELEAVEASPICQAYVDFCIATASTGSCLELLAALVPCGVGYGEIGMRISPVVAQQPDHPYAQWVGIYASLEYQQYVDWMIAALNEMGQEINDRQFVELARLFKLGCRYEWLFWEMAWKEDRWPV